MFSNIYISALWSPPVNPAGNTFPNSRMKYSFVCKWRGVGVGGGNYRDFLKWDGGVFRSISYNNYPFLYNFGQKSTKKRCGICSTKLTTYTLECHQCFSLFSCFQCFFDALVNFAQISYLFLEFTVLVWAGKYPPSIFWLVHLFAFILLAFLLQWKFRFSILNL